MTDMDFAVQHNADDTLAPKEKRTSSSNDEEYGSKEMPQAGAVDPYGDEFGAEIQYKTMKWWQGAIGNASNPPEPMAPPLTTSQS